MAWVKPQNNNEEKINTESFVTKTINNVLDYDFKVAIGEIPQADYTQRFNWLVTTAESACEGARLIKRSNQFIDWENLSPVQQRFMESARDLFRERFQGNPNTQDAHIEIQARGALEEIVLGAYDAKKNLKAKELRELVTQGKISNDEAIVELARYKLKLLIESAEAKKTIRKEMNQ